MDIKKITLQPEIARAVEDLGYTQWTEIQDKTMPAIQQGMDVIGQSHTGSGKTAAFGLPMLEKIVHRGGIQALILVPTRELCEQVSNEMVKFAKYKKTNVLAVYGGVSINMQIDKLPYADIVVGTPGRILDHLQRGTLNLGKVKILVLDEADKMFEMGFIDDVKKIISQTPSNRQTLLFSATFSSQVEDIIRRFMHSPQKVRVQSYVDSGKLVQHFYVVEAKDKFSLLVHLLKTEPVGLTMIFCATRRMVDSLTRNLYKQDIKAQPLHGGLSQNRRKQSIDLFHSNKADILVASDVAARGLDIKNVSYVINYDIPKTSKEYIHRIGRTARAGSEGKVISLLAPQDHDNFRSVMSDESLIMEQVQLPSFERIQFAKPERSRFSSDHGRSGSGPRRFGQRPGGFHRRDSDSRNSSEGSGERSEGSRFRRSSSGSSGHSGGFKRSFHRRN
jgi:ATP-dependent RNA helicase DeaD